MLEPTTYAEGHSRTWSVYIVKCRGGQLYTGISIDVDKRFSEHQKDGYKCAK